MLLENYIVVIVIEEHRNGAELGGSTACLWNLIGLQEMDLPKQHNFMLIVQIYGRLRKKKQKTHTHIYISYIYI